MKHYCYCVCGVTVLQIHQIITLCICYQFGHLYANCIHFPFHYIICMHFYIICLMLFPTYEFWLLPAELSSYDITFTVEILRKNTTHTTHSRYKHFQKIHLKLDFFQLSFPLLNYTLVQKHPTNTKRITDINTFKDKHK